MNRCSKVCRLAWRVYSRRTDPGDPFHTGNKKHYMTMIENAKKQHWDSFLAPLNEKSIWTMHCYASGDPSDGSKAQIPTLKATQTELGSAAT